MERIRERVRQARRRLTAQRFADLLPWTVFWLLLAAMAAVVTPKLWPIEVDRLRWPLLWIGGAAAGGFLAAAIGSWLTRCAALEAAIELDRRCGLKERLSSTLSLAEEDQRGEMGLALLEDAARRAERLDVADRFRISTGWRAGLPLLAAAAALAVAFLIPDARDRAAASPASADARRRIENAAEALKKEMAKRRREAESEGLKDAERIFREIEQGIDQLQKGAPADRRQAMIQLNDLATELERRRRRLGDPEQLRRRFQPLRDVGGGPAEKLVKALEQGDFGEAARQLEALKDQLNQKGLSEQQKQALARQFAEMADRLREAADARQQAVADLERRARQARESGDLSTASRLERQLDELLEQSSDTSRMREMAEALSQSAKSLDEGDAQEASDLLDQLSESLDEMESELDESEALGEAMTEIAQAKQSMNCPECDGAG